MRVAAVLSATAVGMALSCAAGAQNVPAPGPADPSVSVPPVRYESAFSDYQSHRDQPLREWIGVNDEMRRLGGHAGHLGDSSSQSTAPGSDPKLPAVRRPSPDMPHHGGGHR